MTEERKPTLLTWCVDSNAHFWGADEAVHDKCPELLGDRYTCSCPHHQGVPIDRIIDGVEMRAKLTEKKTIKRRKFPKPDVEPTPAPTKKKRRVVRRSSR